jgi:hypothetical protein
VQPDKESRPKTYIDDHGVRRGYYVYAHKDVASGVIFYIGKGSDNRAWVTDRRGTDWHGRVSTLKEGWTVEILEEDLSEDEAFGREFELIEEHGGPGGDLVNVQPGGEFAPECTIGLNLNDDGWYEYYSASRSFNKFPRGEQEAIASTLAADLKPIDDPLAALEDVVEDDDDESKIWGRIRLKGIIAF